MMTKTMQLLRASLRDRAGVSSMEYGVLAIAILGAVVGGLALLTPQITALFTAVATAITNAITAA
jgi:Flp pilus assembly pilin Flp